MDNLSSNKPVVKPAAKKEEVETKAQKEAKVAIVNSLAKIETQLTDLLSKELSKAEFKSDNKVYKKIKDLITTLSTEAKKVVDSEKAKVDKKSELDDRYKL